MATHRFLGDAPAPALIRQTAEQAHYHRSRYGDFVLTEAIRAEYPTDFIPVAGFRDYEWINKATGEKHDVLVAAVSAERLFEVFLELASVVGDVIHLVLETAHDRKSGDKGHDHVWARDLDNVCTRSALCEFEDVLLHDGYAGICVMNSSGSREVQWTDDKTLEIHARKMGRFRRVLEGAGLVEKPDLKCIYEVPHFHVGSPELRRGFEAMAARFGVDRGDDDCDSGS